MIFDPKRIYFHHQRPLGVKKLSASHYLKVDASPRGGITFAIQVNPDTGVVRYAASICSMKDNFSRKIGRAVSFGRLQKSKQFQMVLADETGKASLPDIFHDLVGKLLEDYNWQCTSLHPIYEPGLCETLSLCLPEYAGFKFGRGESETPHREFLEALSDANAYGPYN